MKKIGEIITAIRTFISEVHMELKKCAWPGRPELIESTVVVIVSVLIVSLFVGLSDVLLAGVMRLVIR